MSTITIQRLNPLCQRLWHACAAWVLPALLLGPAFAARAGQSGDFTYSTDGASVTITKYTGAGGAVTIPPTIIGLPVTSIGDMAFLSCSNLASVTIPNSVTGIGLAAFGECTRLTSVTIPNSVTSIGEWAFFDCASLAGVTIPGGVTTIGSDTFSLCSNLTRVTIPNSVTSIGDNAFFSCSKLASVTIPGSVATIGSNAFGLCLKLTSVTIPNSVTSIGDEAFDYCAGLTSVTIPNSVTTIGRDTFSLCTNLTKITIPNSVTSVGFGAFSYCLKLTSVTIPNSVTSIGDEAFGGCSGLTNVTIPNSVASIGANAFASCAKLTAVNCQGNAPSVGSDVFDEDTNATVYYLLGTTGWGTTFGGRPTVLVEFVPPSLSITSHTNLQLLGTKTITLAGTASDAGNGDNGIASVTVNGVRATNDTAAGAGVANWSKAVNLIPGANKLVVVARDGRGNSTTNSISVISDTAAPTLAITNLGSGQRWSNAVFTVKGTAKDNMAVASVLWQLNGGAWSNAITANNWTNWSAALTLTMYSNTLKTCAVDTAGNCSITNNVSFLYILSGTLTVRTNGSGTVSPNYAGKLLALDTNYTVTATAGAGYVFSNWVNGAGAVLTNGTVLQFTMQSNLTLAASFVTNLFLVAQGAYNGLFAPENPPRRQTNSGSFTVTVTSSGVLSGNLFLGSNTISLNGKFDVSGKTQILSTPKGGKPLTTTLQLNLADHSVQGTVTDGSFTAILNGDQSVFSSTHKATNFQGQYTLIIPGTNDPAIGPFGTSYGTVTVDAVGKVVLAGSLADGTTSVSQSSVVSKDGFWPFYVPLYNGAGSLWGWNYFTNHTIVSAPLLSWINATNSTKTAVYRSGFTNQQATLIGSFYTATNKPLLSLTNAQVLLQEGNLPFSIINQVTLATNGTITVPHIAENTNGLTLTITAKLGLISGSFLNPANAKQMITVNGVLLQDQTNAAGYFMGTNQSGAFMVVPQ